MGDREKSNLSTLRNAEIVRLCMSLAEQRMAQGEVVKMNLIVKEAYTYPSSRFWVSEERAMTVIRAWQGHDIKGKPYPKWADPERMEVLRLAMYEEIYSRFKILARKFSGESKLSIMHRVVSSPAPSYYITPESMLIFFYTHRKRHAKKFRK